MKRSRCFIWAILVHLFACGGFAAAPLTPLVIDAPTLDQIIGVGSGFLQASQLPGGNFAGAWQPDSGFEDTHEPEIQAEILWVLSQCHRRDPSNKRLEQIVRQGLRFFILNSDESGKRLIPQHPYGENAETATVAFLTLALVETIETSSDLPKTERESYLAALQQYVNFMLTMQTASGRYHGRYRQANGKAVPIANARTDGVVLLAMTRTLRLINSPQLRKLIDLNVKAMLAATVNAEPSPEFDPRSPMAFCAYGLAGIADFAIFTGDERRQRECVRIAGLLVQALPTEKNRHSRIPQLYSLAKAWPLIESYGDRPSANQYALLLQQELGTLARRQIGGPQPDKSLPVWTAVAGGLAENNTASTVEVQPSAEFIAAALAIRTHLFPPKR